MAITVKPGAVAGTIPASFLRIPLQSAAQMGTALLGKPKQIARCFKPVDQKLGTEHAPAGSYYIGVGIFFSLKQITQ